MSDWLEALAAEPRSADLPVDNAPGWLALLAEDDGDSAPFRDAPLMRGGKADALAPAPEPEAASEAPDPEAEAVARAYAEGVAAGRAAAEAEIEALGKRQRALRLTFRTLDEAALGVLADDLAATVQALCDSVLGEAAQASAGLRERCEAAARRIGAAPDKLVLHLHPDDIGMLEAGTLAVMRIATDAALERGSVVIEGPDGTIADGPAEWRRAIAAAVRG